MTAPLDNRMRKKDEVGPSLKGPSGQDIMPGWLDGAGQSAPAGLKFGLSQRRQSMVSRASSSPPQSEYSLGTGPIRRQRMPPPPKKASPPLSASPPESLESSRSASAATAATDHSEAVREAKRSGELKKLEFMRDSLKSAKQKVVLQNWQDQVNNMRQSKEASSQAREARIQNVMSHTQTHIKAKRKQKSVQSAAETLRQKDSEKIRRNILSKRKDSFENRQQLREETKELTVQDRKDQVDRERRRKLKYEVNTFLAAEQELQRRRDDMVRRQQKKERKERERELRRSGGAPPSEGSPPESPNILHQPQPQPQPLAQNLSFQSFSSKGRMQHAMSDPEIQEEGEEPESPDSSHRDNAMQRLDAQKRDHMRKWQKEYGDHDDLSELESSQRPSPDINDNATSCGSESLSDEDSSPKEGKTPVGRGRSPQRRSRQSREPSPEDGSQSFRSRPRASRSNTAESLLSDKPRAKLQRSSSNMSDYSDAASLPVKSVLRYSRSPSISPRLASVSPVPERPLSRSSYEPPTEGSERDERRRRVKHDDRDEVRSEKSRSAKRTVRKTHDLEREKKDVGEREDDRQRDSRRKSKSHGRERDVSSNGAERKEKDERRDRSERGRRKERHEEEERKRRDEKKEREYTREGKEETEDRKDERSRRKDDREEKESGVIEEERRRRRKEQERRERKDRERREAQRTKQEEPRSSPSPPAVVIDPPESEPRTPLKHTQRQANTASPHQQTRADKEQSPEMLMSELTLSDSPDASHNQAWDDSPTQPPHETHPLCPGESADTFDTITSDITPRQNAPYPYYPPYPYPPPPWYGTPPPGQDPSASIPPGYQGTPPPAHYPHTSPGGSPAPYPMAVPPGVGPILIHPGYPPPPQWWPWPVQTSATSTPQQSPQNTSRASHTSQSPQNSVSGSPVPPPPASMYPPYPYYPYPYPMPPPPHGHSSSAPPPYNWPYASPQTSAIQSPHIAPAMVPERTSSLPNFEVDASQVPHSRPRPMSAHVMKPVKLLSQPSRPERAPSSPSMIQTVHMSSSGNSSSLLRRPSSDRFSGSSEPKLAAATEPKQKSFLRTSTSTWSADTPSEKPKRKKKVVKKKVKKTDSKK